MIIYLSLKKVICEAAATSAQLTCYSALFNWYASYLLFLLLCLFSSQTPHLGGPGLANCGLSDEECQLLQRFDPTKLFDSQTEQSMTCNVDTIGFFIAKFVKNCWFKTK